jgi:hypothetical protein
MADVPFTVINVSFRRGKPASSARSVSFSFIHTNVMPDQWLSGFPFARKCFKRRRKAERALTTT